MAGMTTYQGVLTFHSETGTEGGFWAFQDEKFMGLDAGQQFSCTRCHRVWDKNAQDEPPAPSFTYWQEGYEKDGIRHLAGYHWSDVYLPDGKLHPTSEFDREFTSANNEVARQCAEEGHLGWENMYPDGIWSYEGLHILDDGDELTVWDDSTPPVRIFQGTVKLPPRQDPYAKGAYVAGGGWTAHRRPPEGTEEIWWFEEKRATLTDRE